MKKILALIMAVCTFCSVCACAKTSDTKKTGDGTALSTSSFTQTTEITTETKRIHKYTTTTTEKVTSCIMCLPSRNEICSYVIAWGERAYAFRSRTWSGSVATVSGGSFVLSENDMPILPEAYSNADDVKNIIDGFDGDFFEDHVLLVLTLNFSSGSKEPDAIHVSHVSDERIDVDVSVISPEIQTCDMASWTMILVFEKENIKGNEQINISCR